MLCVWRPLISPYIWASSSSTWMEEIRPPQIQTILLKHKDKQRSVIGHVLISMTYNTLCWEKHSHHQYNLRPPAFSYWFLPSFSPKKQTNHRCVSEERDPCCDHLLSSTHVWSGWTYIVVPGRPARVLLLVQDSLLLGLLEIFLLFLSTQRFPLWTQYETKSVYFFFWKHQQINTK